MRNTIFSFIMAAIAITAGIATQSCSGDQNDRTYDTTPIGITIDSLVSNAAAYVGEKVTITGRCLGFSEHEGRRILLAGSCDSIYIICDATPVMGGLFPNNCTGHNITITGLVQEQSVDENFVKHLEYSRKQREKYITDTAATGKTPGTYNPDSMFAAKMAHYRNEIALARQQGKTHSSIYYIDATDMKID